jgi:hypothetical protein
MTKRKLERTYRFHELDSPRLWWVPGEVCYSSRRWWSLNQFSIEYKPQGNETYAGVNTSTNNLRVCLSGEIDVPETRLHRKRDVVQPF